jgi:ketosteroid isomerase-like protein
VAGPANVEVVRAFFAALGQREAQLRLLHPDVEWHVRPDFPDARMYRGHDGFNEMAEVFGDVFAEEHYEPLDYIEAGSDVVVTLRWGGRGRRSGASFIEREETWVFTVEDGRITTVFEFATKEQALEASRQAN